MNQSSKLSERKIRALPEDLRRELFSYIPRHRLPKLPLAGVHNILLAYGREDLYFDVVNSEKERKRYGNRREAHG